MFYIWCEIENVNIMKGFGTKTCIVKRPKFETNKECILDKFVI